MRCGVIAGTFLTLLLTGCVIGSQPAPAPTHVATLTVAVSLTPEPPTAPRRPTDTQTLTHTPTLAIDTSTPVPVTATPTLPVQSIVLSGHLGWVGNLAWSPDGSILASASGDYNVHDYTARLWKADGTPVALLSAHTAEVYALAWSPDGKVLATGGGDGTVRLWRRDGTLIKTLNSVGSVFGLAWSPNGKILASGSSVGRGKNAVEFWTAEGVLLRTRYTDETGGKFYNVAWSPDGQFIAAGAIDYKLWRSDGTEIFHYTLSGTPAWALAWSPDSQRWVIGDENGRAHMYDTSGQALAELDDPVGDINCLAWSPDGRFLVGGDGVGVWQADGRRLALLAANSPSAVTAVAWSPDGTKFAVGAARNYGRSPAKTDHAVRIWNADRQLLATLDSHTDAVNTIAWSPNGKILASGSNDKTIRLWILPDSIK